MKKAIRSVAIAAGIVVASLLYALAVRAALPYYVGHKVLLQVVSNDGCIVTQVGSEGLVEVVGQGVVELKFINKDEDEEINVLCTNFTVSRDGPMKRKGELLYLAARDTKPLRLEVMGKAFLVAMSNQQVREARAQGIELETD